VGTSAEPPQARGVRQDWQTVPEHIRHAFEAWAGSPVVSAISQVHGFSPGVAARLKLADGRGLFVKAVSSEPNAQSPAFHRREARIVGALPLHVPVPRLQWVHDDGEGGWIVLVFEEADGVHPRQPWQSDELQQVLDGMADLFDKLTPSPLPLGALPSASERVIRPICGWQRLLHSDSAEVRQRLDPWSQRHLARLAELEAQAPAAVSGDTLLHFDIRADNVLLGAEHVWFFDWPHACIGADWFDVVGFVPSVTMQGGPPPEEVFARYPASRSANPADVTCGIATLAGYFVRQSLLPPPPGLPTLRAFQAAQGGVACQWLAQRTGLR
jgi:aminoglycoside phosphotransferase (APT) family kinase protein